MIKKHTKTFLSKTIHQLLIIDVTAQLRGIWKLQILMLWIKATAINFIAPFLAPALYCVHITGLARKKMAGAWSPLAFFYPRQVVSYRWSKKQHFSLTMSCRLAKNWLQKLETKHCVYFGEVISVLMCVCLCLSVCGISVWFIYNKTKLPSCKMSVFVPYT